MQPLIAYREVETSTHKYVSRPCFVLCTLMETIAGTTYRST